MRWATGTPRRSNFDFLLLGRMCPQAITQANDHTGKEYRRRLLNTAISL